VLEQPKIQYEVPRRGGNPDDMSDYHHSSSPHQSVRGIKRGHKKSQHWAIRERFHWKALDDHRKKLRIGSAGHECKENVEREMIQEKGMV
jgi:hypothetical protein